MGKWEYLFRIARFDRDAGVWKFPEERDAPNRVIGPFLDTVGSYGWELVAVVPRWASQEGRITPDSEGMTYMEGHNTFTLKSAGGPDGLMFFFKRPAKEADEN